jgi:hypothetical protein
MISNNSVTKWLLNYISAWKSYDPEAIGALFSEDAAYRYNPFDEPLQGRAAIVTNWLENRDTPNTYSADYKVVAVDGNTAVSNGRTQYYEADGKTPLRQFDNIFLLRFDEDGRCLEFCEWFMEPR